MAKRRCRKPPPPPTADQAIAEQIRLGLSSMSVAGKTANFLNPKDRLDALERIEEREAARNVETIQHAEDGIYW